MAQESWDPSDACQQQAPQQKQQQEGLALCSNNCGLLASTMNLCSKCFRELSVKQGSPSSMAPKSISLDKDPSAFIDDKSHVQQLYPEASSELRQIQSQIGSAAQFASAGSSNESALQKPCRDLSPSSADKPCFLTRDLISDILAQDATSQSSSSNSLPARRQPSNRCLTCKKRTGLLGFKCRCGNVFCAHHRYSDKHDCPYDYKSAAKAAIAKANPVIKAQKITKI